VAIQLMFFGTTQPKNFIVLVKFLASFTIYTPTSFVNTPLIVYHVQVWDDNIIETEFERFDEDFDGLVDAIQKNITVLNSASVLVSSI